MQSAAQTEADKSACNAGKLSDAADAPAVTPAPGAAGEGRTEPPRVLSPQLLGGGWGLL